MRMKENENKLSYKELEKQFLQLKKKLEAKSVDSKVGDHECCNESERLRTIIENSQAGYFFIDNDGLFQKVNHAWLKLYKYEDRKEVLGKHFVEVQQIEDIENARIFVEGIRNQDAKYTTGEFSRKCSDGSTGYHSFSAKPVFKKNKIIGIEGFIIDITERVEIEKKLRESEEKYKAIYENVPLSYQSLDFNGNFIDVNPTWLSTLGYKREEVIGKNYADFLHPNWRGHFEKNFPEFKRRGYVSNVEFRIKHKDGHFLDISFEGCIGLNPDGSFKQTYCVFKDITESKRIEQALIVNQYYLSKAQEIGQIGTWELDVVNNILYWTKENYKVFGVKPGTKLNYEVFKNCVHPDDLEYVDREWLAALKGKPYDIEHRVIANGKTKWVREKADVKFDEQGNAISAIGFTQEITSFKETEFKLKESERKFRILADNTNDWEYWLDEHNNYVFISKSCEKFTGYNAQEFYDNPGLFVDLVREDYRQEVQSHFHDKNRTSPLFISEFPIINKDNKEVWIEHSCIPIFDDGGKFLGRRGNNRDITEKKKTEHELKESKGRFELAMKASRDGLYDWDLVTNEIYYSPGWKKMLGYEDDELPNDFSVWENLTKPEDVERSQEIQQEMLSKQRDRFELELKMKHKKGSWVDILSRAEAVFNEEGKAIRIVGTHVDITNKKEIENQLKESEERFRQITDYAQEWIWEVDSKGLFTYSSPVVEKLLGYTPDEIVGKKHFYDLFLSADRRVLKEAALKIFKEKEEIKNFVNRNIHKNGKEVWLSTSGVPMLNEHGELIGYRGLDQDITEQRTAELALESVAKQFSMLSGLEFFENACKYLTENLNVDIAFVGKFVKGKTVDVIAGIDNGELLERFGYDLEDTPCEKVAKGDICFYDDGIQTLFPKDILLIEMGIEAYAGIPLVGRSGDPLGVFVLLNRKPIQSKDLHLNLLQIFSGKITAELERMEAEQSLKQALNRAEESDRLKTAFLSNMSHEIRTPMNGIVGFTELLQDPDLPEVNQREYVTIIQKSSERLLSTVNDIIEISKIESGEVSVSKEKVDVVELIESFVDFFRPEATKKNLEISFDNLTGKPKCLTESDKIKLTSIVSNLIKNAIKYTDSGYIKLGLKVNNESLVLSCKDSGIGIPKHRHEAIFNRFEQADLEDKQAHEGSGLGLAIVKSYVEMLDGKIWVESEEMKGTVFYVALPVSAPEMRINLIEQGTGITPQKKKDIKILIVEDDEISSLHLSVITKDLAQTVQLVTNGLEAIRACEKQSDFDLIFMDIKMPVMDGFEATREIRKFNSDVVIIAQTAFAFYEDHQKALAAGCNDFISKPIKKAELVKLVNKYF